MEPPPPIDRKLVEWLEKAYPYHPPDENTTERQDVYRSGQQRIIEILRNHLEKQEQSIYGDV